MPGLGSEDRPTLAVLVREYLLDGHLIDRAGMPHLIGAFGRDVMRDIAIDEWMGASPVYLRSACSGPSASRATRSRRSSRTSSSTSGHRRSSWTSASSSPTGTTGAFWLDHCGALMDVEPMGPDYVRAMCHDIEDPTFDATATASNPRAQMRPVHWPPRRARRPVPPLRVDGDHRPVPHPAAPGARQAVAIGATRAASFELDPIDPDDPGTHDYPGPLQRTCGSRTGRPRRSVGSPRRCVCRATSSRCRSWPPPGSESTPTTRPVSSTATSSPGWPAWRATRLTPHSTSARGSTTPPWPWPAAPDSSPRPTPASGSSPATAYWSMSTGRHPRPADAAWPSLLVADHLEPLDAIVGAVDRQSAGVPSCPTTTPDSSSRSSWVRDERPVPDDVRLTEFSTGADFTFVDRGTPVVLGRKGVA